MPNDIAISPSGLGKPYKKKWRDCENNKMSYGFSRCGFKGKNISSFFKKVKKVERHLRIEHTKDEHIHEELNIH
jgi:hypothetical protein